MGVDIVGAYHTKFGRLEDDTLYSLYAKATHETLKDAGISPAEIDGVFVGNFSGGTFNNQENIAPYGVNIAPALRHKPMYRTETACTSGSSAIHMGIMAIRAGLMKRVLVIGLEKMTSVGIEEITRTLSLATLWPQEGQKAVNAPCMFADLARGWLQKYGYSKEELRKWLAAISAKAYVNAAENELAQLQKARSAEEILALPEEKNPIIHDPLRLHDCSLVSDGAAGIVLQATGLNDVSHAVSVESFYNASDYLDSFGKNKSDYFLEGAHYAIQKVLNDADVNLSHIDLAEVHDCFTITELLMYSALGLTAPGREFEAVEHRTVYKEGQLPINLSGGLKAKGHPIGATGVAMHAYIYKQLVGEAWGNQLPDPKYGLVVNIGGSGTSNCATVLRKW